MKACLDCGTVASNNQAICGVCGRPTPWRILTAAEAAELGGGTEESLQSTSPEFAAWQRNSRPTGDVPRFGGLVLIGIGLLLAIIAGAMSVTSYSFVTSATELDPDKVATKALLTLIAEALFGLGLTLWLAGYIVHAISFLPGKDDLAAAASWNSNMNGAAA